MPPKPLPTEVIGETDPVLQFDVAAAQEVIALVHKLLLVQPPEREVTLAEADLLLRIRAIYDCAEGRKEKPCRA